MLAKLWRNWITHTLLGSVNDSYFGKQFVSFCNKTKDMLTTKPSNHTSGHLAKINEDLFSRRNLYTNIHSSLICQSSKLETHQMSFHGWMVKQTVVHPYHRILLRNTKEQTIDSPTGMDLKGIMLSEKSRSVWFDWYDVYEIT